jgi:stress-induced morphogen
MWQYQAVPTTLDAIRERLRAAFPDASIEVRDTTGGDDHFDARVLSSAFAGRREIERHRMVYAALGELMRSQIHALSLVTEESNKP